MSINYKKCPKCGSKNSIPIVYGLPAPELFEKAEAGKVKLGGCCIEENSPEYFCKDCNYEWDKNQAIDKAYRQIKGIKASVGDFFWSSYLVEVDLINYNVIWTKNEGVREIETDQKSLTANTVEQFIDQLKSVNLLRWNTSYVDPHVLDGIEWNVEIFREGRNLRKYGINAFPDQWDEFCSVIVGLTERDFH